MATLPAIRTYQRQVVANDPGGRLPHTSGFDPVGQGLERLGGAIGDAGNAIAGQQRQADNEANQAADLMNRTMQAANRAQAQAVELSGRDSIADLADEFKAGIQDGTIDKTKAAEEWKKKAGDLIEQTSGTAPAAHQAEVRQALMLRSDRFQRGAVMPAVIARNRSDTGAAIDQTLEYAQRMSLADPANAKKIASDTLDQLGPFAGLDAKKIADKKQAFVEGAAYTRAFTAVTSARTDNRALGKVEANLAADTEIDPQKKAVLLGQITGYKAANDQRAEIAAARADRLKERQLRDAEHEFNAFQGLADKGGALDPAYVDRVVQATAGTPYQAAVKSVAEQIHTAGGMALQPIASQQAHLQALDAQIAAGGRNEELDKRREQLAKIATASKSDAERDPLAAYAERGGGVAPPLDFSTLDGLAQGLPARVEHAKTVGTWVGKPVSPLNDAEAAHVADQLAALPVDQRSTRIAQLSQAMTPRQAQALAQQIDGKDRGLALEFAAGSAMTTQGRTVAELIGRGSQALKEKTVKEDTTAGAGLRSQLAAEVGDSLSGKARDDVIDAARLIYLGQSAEGSSPDVARAVRIAIGGQWVEQAGKKIPVPAGVDNFPERLAKYPAAAIAQQAPDGHVYASGHPIEVPAFLSALPSAQLEPAGTGRYFVRSGGSLVTNKDRQPITIEVR